MLRTGTLCRRPSNQRDWANLLSNDVDQAPIQWWKLLGMLDHSLIRSPGEFPVDSASLTHSIATGFRADC